MKKKPTCQNLLLWNAIMFTFLRQYCWLLLSKAITVRIWKYRYYNGRATVEPEQFYSKNCPSCGHNVYSKHQILHQAPVWTSATFSTPSSPGDIVLCPYLGLAKISFLYPNIVGPTRKRGFLKSLNLTDQKYHLGPSWPHIYLVNKSTSPH